VQLIEISDQFEAMGLSVVAMTYDSVELLKTVEEDEGIEFTLLHDEGITHVNALGILNENYEPGSRAYGVPHPGIFLLDTDGVIQFKFAEERYQDRPDFAFVVEAAETLQD
jgi:peroxiredoxin